MVNFRQGLLAAVAGLTLGLTPLLASAQEHFTHHEFHEHDARLFRGHDLDVWHGGHWFHQWINGRFGWWYFAGGVWYFYDTPVYPYPMVVSEMSYIEPMAAPPPVAPGAPSYYYCDSPAGYYPYVTKCAVPFRPVPAAPPAAPPAPTGYAPPPGATVAPGNMPPPQ